MAVINQVGNALTGSTGTGTFVGSASPTLTGTPLIGASPYAVGIITPWVAYTPTFTGFGTAASVEVWSRRVGDTLEVRGRFNSGTSTAVEARMTLGFNGTNANVSISGTAVTNITVCGNHIINVSGVFIGYTLMAASLGYLTFSAASAVGNAFSSANGSSLIASGSTLGFQAFVPVTTWP